LLRRRETDQQKEMQDEDSDMKLTMDRQEDIPVGIRCLIANFY